MLFEMAYQLAPFHAVTLSVSRIASRPAVSSAS